MLRKFISILIIIELITPRVYSATADNSDGADSSNIETLANIFAQSSYSPDDRKNIQTQLDFASHIENDGLLNDNPQQYDVFGIANQTLKIKNSDGSIQSIDLNDYRSVVPQIVYTDIRTRYDQNTHELIFEGVKGILPDGTGGEVVAQHIIPNLNLKAIARDNETLSLVDVNGKIHAIDMGYVHDQVFRNPIPVVKNIWEPTYKLPPMSQVEAKYINRGVRPYNENEVDGNSVLMKTAKGEPIFEAGDLMVRYKDNDGKIHLLGVFSRDVTHYRVSMAALYLITQAALIAPNENVIKYMNEVAEVLNSNEIKPEEMHNSVDNIAKRFLQNLDLTQLRSLRDHIEKNVKNKDIDRDTFRYGEWLHSLNELLQQRTLQLNDKQAELEAKLDDIQKKFYLVFKNNKIQKVQDELNDVKKQLENPESELPNNWTTSVRPQHRTNPLDKNLFQKFSAMVGKTFNMKVLATMFISGGLSYLALPFLHDKFEVFQQIATLNWMYDHYEFPVLKDAEYRVTDLLSITCMFTLIIPIPQAISWVAGNSLAMFQKVVGEKIPRVANRLRDIAKAWVPLGNFQRTISFGTRNIYAATIYPLLRAIIQYGLNQKSFYTSLQRGINPFKKVSGESLGFNNPFLYGKKLNEKIALKEKLISLVDFKQKQAKSLAWILALQTVSMRENIDPATLVQVADGDVDASQLEKILKDPQLQKDWVLISHEIYNDLKFYDMDSPDLKDLDPKLVGEFYAIVKRAADKINSMPQSRKNIEMLLVKAKQNSALLINNTPFIAGGYDESRLLRSLYANNQVSAQAFKEMISDCGFSILLYSLWGQRANFADQQNLAADPNGFLFTGRGQLFDMADDARFHLLNNVARQVLIFQGKEARETEAYQPIENISLQSDEREQGFASAALDWFTTTLNPMKSDLGTYYAKNYLKSWTTIQSGLIMSLVLQHFALNRSLGQSFLAFFISFFASDVFFGWADPLTRRGNQMDDERFKAMRNSVNEARFEISQGIKEEDSSQSREQIRNGYKKLFELYKQYNPAALKNLIRFTTKATSQTPPEAQTLNANGHDSIYYGLIAELAIAVKSKDTARIENAQLHMRNYITHESDLTDDDIQKLSAKGLLEFSLSNSPVFTKSNSVIKWFTTFGTSAAAAMLALPFSIRMTNNDYITMDHLGYWIFWNSLLYGSTYLLFSKKIANIYVEKFKQVWNKLKNNKSTNASEPAPTMGIAPKSLVCPLLFE